MPEVPTTAEAGIPDGVLLSNWWALAAPRDTDMEIVNRLAREMRATLAEPEVQKRYVEQGWIAGGGTPSAVADRMRREAAAWKAIVERTGAKVE
jgi:tripartite-type tricarboxylate transporter receptor subunit TctC